jgi:CRP-like cAMP-binding protein
MADAFPLLRRIHLFISLTDDELKQLAAYFKLVTFEKGQTVFQQNDEGDAFYVIEQGQVEISRVTLTGEPRLLSRLVAGDYFGEMALYDHRRRSATVTATTPLVLWRLDQADFDKIILANPKIKPNLDVAIRSRQFTRSSDFLKLLHGERAKDKIDEIVYLVTLQHPIFLYVMLWPSVVVMLAAVALGGAAVYFNPLIPPQFNLWVWVIVGAMFLLGLAWFFWNWVDFHNDWYIVTNRRIIDIDKVVLFFDSRMEVPLGSVSNTTVRASELGQWLGYGDLIVNTFSGPIIFHNVPNPQATADMILEHINRTRIAQRMQERDTLKKMIRQSFAPPEQAPLTKGAPAAAPQKPARPSWLAQLREMSKQFSLDIRAQQGETIIYHKHHYVLIQKIGLLVFAILLVLFTLFLYLLRTFPFHEFPPLTLQDAVVALAAALIPALIFAAVALYQFLDWRNDIYMVTPTQIIDLERKPFGDEQRKAANLEAVMNVLYVRPSFLANILNYGTVTVQAGPGGEMKFYNVYNPPGVQQDIYRRKEARAARLAADAAKARQEELQLYFSAFYEVLEEDRRKREGR